MNISILDTFPRVDEQRIDRMLSEAVAADPHKMVVLDDDPTGVQTVHDITVFTDWSVDSIRAGLEQPDKLFYILTDSRGMTRAETQKIHEEISANVAKAAREVGVPYMFFSRSDSTLRGHFPAETEVLREGMTADGCASDGEILCFFFKEGGRYTFGNVHYVKQGDELVPAAETEFAKDKSFGYVHSDLPGYVEERTGGKYKAEDVLCVSVEQLRKAAQELAETGSSKALDEIVALLESVHDFNKVCVNAVDYVDLKVFSIALYRAIAAGKRFLFRTAAGLVKVAGGISDRPLLQRSDMVHTESRNGGVIVVGSHTKKTTAQLEQLLTLENVVAIPFDSDKVLEGDEAFEKEIARCIAEEEKVILSGKTSVCFTNRKVLSLEGDTKKGALQRSVKISDGVQRLVGQLGVTPAFVVAKGGITSSDVGTKALKVKRARVLGQIMPGVPVWQTDPDSRFPGIPYVIFPGNVGEDDTLKKAVEKLIEG